MVPFCHHLLMCNFFHFIKTNKWKNPSIHLSLALPPFPSSTDRQVFIWAPYICYFYFLFFIVRSTLLCTFISYWTADLLSQMSLIICFFFGKYNVFLFYFSVTFLTVHHFLTEALSCIGSYSIIYSIKLCTETIFWRFFFLHP